VPAPKFPRIQLQLVCVGDLRIFIGRLNLPDYNTSKPQPSIHAGSRRVYLPNPSRSLGFCPAPDPHGLGRPLVASKVTLALLQNPGPASGL
jgi:hypothetical protein